VLQLARRGDLVLTMDPGREGMALLFHPVDEWGVAGPPASIATNPLRDFSTADGFAAIARLVGSEKVIMVVEESFGQGKRNTSSDLALARYTGAAIGAALASIGYDRVRGIVLVPASSWLGALTRNTGRGTVRADRKQTARDHAVAYLGIDHVDGSASTAAHREAFCDAYGIATWWATVYRRAMTMKGIRQ
jgi:hypothetical protein